MKTLTKKEMRKKRVFITLRTMFGALALVAAMILVVSTLSDPIDYVIEVLLGSSILFAVLSFFFHRQVQSSVSVGDYDAEKVLLFLQMSPHSRAPQDYPEKLVQLSDITIMGANHKPKYAQFGNWLMRGTPGWRPTLYFQTKTKDVYSMPLYGSYRKRAQQLLSHGLSPYRDSIEIHTSVAHILNEEKISVALDLPQPTIHDDYATKAQVVKREKIHLGIGYMIVGVLVLIFALGIAFPDSEPIQAVFQSVLRFFEWLDQWFGISEA